jgi:hypothetical protein
VLVGREPAKMRPSKDLTTCGRDCAGSSSVMAELSTWSVRRPEGRSTGCPGRVPGTPGDPSRRAGSQRAAQQETLPLLDRDVHAGGPGATGATSGGRAKLRARGASGVRDHDASRRRAAEPPRRAASAELPRGRSRQLVVRSVRSLIFQSPFTLVIRTSTVCVQDWAPAAVTVHSDPWGAAFSPVFTDFTTY